MELTEIIEKTKTRANITSDYALAKVLGIDRRVISDWKKGKRHPNNEEAIKLATLAGIEEIKVIAAIELKTANTEKKKEFWKSYIESRGLAACLTMTALACAIMLTPEPAEADVLHLQNYDAHSYALNADPIYIMRISKKQPCRLLKEDVEQRASQ